MEQPAGVRVLEEAEDSRQPSEEEVQEYANFLDIDVENEPHLMWIAREGVVAPVPVPWKMCTENDQDFFYFNFETGESVWDHPSDEKYRDMVKEYREKNQKEKAGGANGDSLESGMTSKLDSKLDASINSVTSPGSLPLPTETPAREENSISKVEASRDDSAVRDEVCKFEQDSGMNSSLASAAPSQLNASNRDAVVEKGKLNMMEASSESSASSGGSAPASPRSVHSDASANRSGAVSDAADRSKEPKSSRPGGAIDKDARSPEQAAAASSLSRDLGISSIGGTPQQGLLEASGADVVVDLAGEAASEDGGQITDEESASASMTSPLPSPSAAAAASAATSGGSTIPKRGGDDAAGHSSSEATGLVVDLTCQQRVAVTSEAAVRGWEGLVGRAGEEAARREASAAREREKTSKAEAAPEAKPQAGTGIAGGGGGSAAPSEVSEEYPSEFAATSPAASHSEALGRTSPPHSGTPEPPLQTAVGAEEAVGSGADPGALEAPRPAAATAKQPLGTWAQVEAELASLGRCISMLRDIRQKQAKFMQVLHG